MPRSPGALGALVCLRRHDFRWTAFPQPLRSRESSRPLASPGQRRRPTAAALSRPAPPPGPPTALTRLILVCPGFCGGVLSGGSSLPRRLIAGGPPPCGGGPPAPKALPPGPLTRALGLLVVWWGMSAAVWRVAGLWWARAFWAVGHLGLWVLAVPQCRPLGRHWGRKLSVFGRWAPPHRCGSHGSAGVSAAHRLLAPAVPCCVLLLCSSAFWSLWAGNQVTGVTGDRGTGVAGGAGMRCGSGIRWDRC